MTGVAETLQSVVGDCFSYEYSCHVGRCYRSPASPRKRLLPEWT